MQIKCRAAKSGGIKIRHSFGVFYADGIKEEFESKNRCDFIL